MSNEIPLAIIQSITEFLPISSSGHLALISNLLKTTPDLFLITALHIASLLAVLIFTRKEIFNLLTFKQQYRKLWSYLIIATIPAAIIGYFFQSYIEKSFSSLLFIGIGFIFTGVILLLTKIKTKYSELNYKNSFIIGLFQAIAIFPGISRSGMTISSSLFAGIDKDKAIKFSFLLFIPVALGAFILESSKFYFSYTLLIAFIICFILSLLFLNILSIIIKKNYFWLFSVYCFIIGIVSLVLYFK